MALLATALAPPNQRTECRIPSLRSRRTGVKDIEPKQPSNIEDELGHEGQGDSPGESLAQGHGSPGPKNSKGIPTSEVRKTLPVWIATAAGVGFGPWAPGTWGALEAIVLFALFLGKLGPLAYLGAVVVVSVVGVWASTRAERDLGRHDDGRIVIDEVAGQWVTLFPLIPLRDVALGQVDLSFGLSASSSFFHFDVWTLLVVTGFVAFRWFDIRKPGLVRWAERRFEAGAGVMADDLVAGVYGAIALSVVAYFVLVLRGLV